MRYASRSVLELAKHNSLKLLLENHNEASKDHQINSIIISHLQLKELHYFRDASLDSLLNVIQRPDDKFNSKLEVLNNDL